eukprot:CAMPEP_0113848118 /NCGR_PEP_ID=MMETSP0372-20130328/2279_1 /TAXON_ID=340204 /ORGANISM="Lankesteria abbotti" /LENGTH=240 /DNA_ID=CAMNT_0000817525 /DNA_START=396 /DNA_END=1118 /DNA_ORIENTATION=+ /assembly_acc=CAM_ASM_000359
MNTLVEIKASNDVELFELIVGLSDDDDNEKIQHVAEQLKAYDVLCVADHLFPMKSVIALDKICRQSQKAFFFTLSAGELGMFFADMNSHSSRKPKTDKTDMNDGSPAEELVTTFPSLESTLNCQLNDLVNSVKRNQTVMLAATALLRQLVVGCATFNALQTLINSDLSEDHNLRDDVLSDAQRLCAMAFSQFPPTGAVVGGVLSQEVTKFVTRSGTPLSNIVVFDVLSCNVIYTRVPPSD